MKVRHKAQHVLDWRSHCVLLDRNQRARVLFLAEALERKSKMPGKRNGHLGQIGLQVLRCLAFTFLSMKTGALYPSYDAIQLATGLCRQSVANALARLETCGIVRICRRVVRDRRGVPVQTSSLYSLHEPGCWVDRLPLPKPGARTRFPSRRQLSMLQNMRTPWATGCPSLLNSLKPSTPRGLLANELVRALDSAAIWKGAR